MLDALLEPFDEPEFADGVQAGLLAVLACLAIGALWRWRTGRPAPVGGVFLAGAGLFAVDQHGEFSARTIAAVVVLAVSGTLVDAVRWPPLVSVVVAVPCGYWLGEDPALAHEPWIGWLLAAAVALGGPLLADLDRRHRDRGLGPTLILATAGGMYSTLPDTEQALAFLGAALVVAAAGWPLRLVSLGTGGSLAVVATVPIVSALGGVGRHRAIVAGVCCLGLMVVEPLAVRLGRRGGTGTAVSTSFWTPVLLGLHVALVLFAARAAGFLERPMQVGAVFAVGAAASAAALVGVGSVLAGPRRDRPAV